MSQFKMKKNKKFRSNKQLTIRELAEKLNISCQPVQSILPGNLENFQTCDWLNMIVGCMDMTLTRKFRVHNKTRVILLALRKYITRAHFFIYRGHNVVRVRSKGNNNKLRISQGSTATIAKRCTKKSTRKMDQCVPLALQQIVVPHLAFNLRVFDQKKMMLVCPYPPYSSDLAPCDLWFYTKIKTLQKTF